MEKQNEELKADLLNLKERVEQALALLAQGNVEEAEDVVCKAIVASGFMPDISGTQGAALQGKERGITKPTEVPEGSRVLEGVFDGQHMMGADGKQYLVPPNYASKSKLVEGDLLKLSITPQGAFIYKQIGPINRKRVVCTLTQHDNGMWEATDGVQRWRLLTAAVTYFHGKVDDEVVIIIPSETPSKWAAVENIIAR